MLRWYAEQQNFTFLVHIVVGAGRCDAIVVVIVGLVPISDAVQRRRAIVKGRIVFQRVRVADRYPLVVVVINAWIE